MAELDQALAEALRPMLKKMVEEEVERAKTRWRWATIAQAVEILGLSEHAIRWRIKEGLIPAKKVEGRWFIDLLEYDRRLSRLR